ncbi:MAG: N-acetyltransferase [Rhizobiales bacterium]|nr:N-acetyltransferase [Hyphomicrobiales bacterium]MBI3673929.1 N-acetyltransferase [Hyphomicrobiales bacterium]
MTFHLLISETKPSDQPRIEHLLDKAFGLDRRTKSSYRLREGNHTVPGLSLVVRDEDVGIAGSVSFWPLAIGEAGTPALLLGPLAVHPARQRLGIGLELMREGLARARAMGHRLVILVGDEPYYGKLGFRRLPHNLCTMPGPTNPERLLYLELEPGALAGVHGLVLPPHRHHGKDSAPLAVPEAAEAEKQHAEA